MLWAVLRRLVAALTLITFASGMTLQLMPPKAAVAASAMADSGDCLHMTMPPDDTGAAQKVPCKGMDPECIKQMGCLGTPSLPLRLGGDLVQVVYTMVTYWTPAQPRDGRSIKPDLLPPISL